MNQHQSINLRQLCLGYFIYSTSVKLLTLPATLVQGSGNWAWLATLLGVAVELLLVGIATMILRWVDTRQMGFRGLCFVLVPLIAVEIWLTGQQIYDLAYADLSTNLSLIIFMITLVLLGIFFLTRQPRAVFRSGEILWIFYLVGLVIAIVPTLYTLQVNWGELVQGDWTTVWLTAGGNLLFFESASFVLAFGSETKKTSRELGKINLTAWLCGLGYALFMLLFVILFGPLGATKPMGIVEMTAGAQSITANGNLDWLIIITTLAALVLRFGVQLVAVVTLIKRGLAKK